jgi:hypothetical protein
MNDRNLARLERRGGCQMEGERQSASYQYDGMTKGVGWYGLFTCLHLNVKG